MGDGAGPVRLVYLAGTGRSGSTLLGRLLGEVDGFVYLGEASRYLFHDRMRARLPACGCGQPVASCPFWRDHDAAVDPWLRARATAGLRLRRLLRPALLGRRPPWGEPAVGAAIEAMLHRVRDASAARVLVDGSKNPANGLALAGRPGVALHVLHLVRHPGGVVSSWSRPKGYLRGHGTLRILGWWWATNVFAELLGRRAASYHRVRYEDAVADPAAVLERIVGTVLDPTGGPVAVDRRPRFRFLAGRTATLGPQHVLAGNPDKLRGGTVTIRERGWRLDSVRRVLVAALAWPLMRRYGYRIGANRAGDRSPD